MSPRFHRLLLVAAVVSFVVRPPAVSAAVIEGVKFAPSVQRADLSLQLNCTAMLRWYLIKAYVAGLYLAPGTSPTRVLDDVPKRLELSYFWKIEGGDFGPAGEKILQQNIDAATLAKLRPQLDQISALYETVQPGDRYALTYVPGIGTELALNGKAKGIIEGADFARAYFSIWLGTKPISASFRDALISCSQAG